jgi:hypothetical protein
MLVKVSVGWEFHERLHTRVAAGESSETIDFTQSCEEPEIVRKMSGEHGIRSST